MTWPELWYGKSPSSVVLRTVLLPFSWGYAAGWSMYRWLYDSGLKKAVQPHRPILCVGNLTVGGSGKTPLTVHIARELQSMGYRLVLSCSGYGAPKSEGATLAPDGPLDPSEWGDEPALLRTLLPDVPIVVGRARVEAAELIHKMTDKCEKVVMLMDDGFQHLPLAKTASILIDPISANHACLPAGPYREPWRNLIRADEVLGEGRRFSVESRIVGFQDLQGNSVDAPKEADALCAIGRPEAFRGSLEALGTKIGNFVALPDHHSLAGVLGRVADPCIVTAKDAVKLRLLREAQNKEILVALHEVVVEPRQAFHERLKELVDR